MLLNTIQSRGDAARRNWFPHVELRGKARKMVARVRPGAQPLAPCVKVVGSLDIRVTPYRPSRRDLFCQQPF
jgi:hypothetical protein